MYKFHFWYMHVMGLVEVYPGGAYVTWNGQGFHSEHTSPGMGMAILKARIALRRG